MTFLRAAATPLAPALLLLTGCGSSTESATATTTLVATVTSTTAAPASSDQAATEPHRDRCITTIVDVTTRAYRPGGNGSADLQALADTQFGQQCQAIASEGPEAAAVRAEILGRLPEDVRNKLAAESQQGRAASEQFSQIGSQLDGQ